MWEHSDQRNSSLRKTKSNDKDGMYRLNNQKRRPFKNLKMLSKRKNLSKIIYCRVIVHLWYWLRVQELSYQMKCQLWLMIRYKWILTPKMDRYITYSSGNLLWIMKNQKCKLHNVLILLEVLSILNFSLALMNII